MNILSSLVAVLVATVSGLIGGNVNETSSVDIPQCDDKTQSISTRVDCYTNYAVIRKDKAVCNKIKKISSGNDADFWFCAATASADLDLCSKIPKDNSRMFPANTLEQLCTAIVKKDVTLCKGQTFPESCELGIGISNGLRERETKYCCLANSTTEKESCLTTLSTYFSKYGIFKETQNLKFFCEK